MQRRVFALDFDGLICDGFKECTLVTWNGYHHKEISAFGERGLELIHGEFLQRFREYRNFATHLGHFLVSLSWGQKPIQTQQEFNAAYAALQRSDVEHFVRDVTAYRERARTERRREWLGSHALYPGIDRLLRESPVPLYVVTAKDGPSVLEILRSHGIPFSHELRNEIVEELMLIAGAKVAQNGMLIP